MKKILIYAAIITPIALLWFHWGGFKNDMGTLLLMSAAVFSCFVAKDKISARTGDEKK